MLRSAHRFSIAEDPANSPADFISRALSWLSGFSHGCLFQSAGQDSLGQYDVLVLAGSLASSNDWRDFRSKAPQDWTYLHLCYESFDPASLGPERPDPVRFPLFSAHVPETILILRGAEVEILSIHEPAGIFEQILAKSPKNEAIPGVRFQPGISRDEYFSTLDKLRAHIARGDCYEINYCQPFLAHAGVDVVAVYSELASRAGAPFSAFYRTGDHYLLSASPERFFQLRERKLVSQPMKGTASRGKTAAEDADLKHRLSQSVKDRSENVMIVDLVRNDMSRVCDNVHVTELFEVHEFPGLFQMISTVRGELRPGLGIADILEACFPMGSMTGAPKQRVRELTAEYEPFKRGIYSGTLGYITPEGDADFSVVIRSLAYNAATQALSFHTGGGITFASDPQQEYEECMLKAAGLLSVFDGC